MEMSNLEAVSNVNLKSAISVKVAQKAMDSTKAQGEAVVELIKSAGRVGKGGVDSAGHVDVQA
jgi:hypothetical protein